MEETHKQNASTNFFSHCRKPTAAAYATNNAGVLINLRIQLLHPYPTSLFLGFWLWKRDKLNNPLYTLTIKFCMSCKQPAY